MFLFISGGKLKTPADADSESLQAKWVEDVKDLSLRASDIHGIIKIARDHRSNVANNQPVHQNVLPAIKPHKKLLLRLVVCARQKIRSVPKDLLSLHVLFLLSQYSFHLMFHISSNCLHVLLSEKTEVHFPLCEINHNRNLHSLLLKFMKVSHTVKA